MFAPQHRWLEDDPFPFGVAYFSGAMAVLGRAVSLFLVVQNNFEPPSEEPSCIEDIIV